MTYIAKLQDLGLCEWSSKSGTEQIEVIPRIFFLRRTFSMPLTGL
jgi:hypothetical protein